MIRIWISAACACAMLATSSLGQTDLMTLRGVRPDSLFGVVATIADLDGDGVREFVVGEPGNFLNHSPEPGRAWVHSGRDGEQLFEFVGDNSGDCFGSSVADAGDVDGDSVGDVLVGAFQYLDFKLTGPGYARIFSGAHGGVIRTLQGTKPNSGFGSYVSGVGDVDADGFDDALISAHWEDANGATYAGAVHLFSGQTGTELFTFGGSTYFSYTGFATCRLGDINADGHDDFVVGAFGEQVNGLNVGAVHVFSGKDFSEIYALTGPVEWGDFGSALGGGGDLDDDGVPDFVVGATAADSYFDLGRAYVYSGADGSLIRLHGGPVWQDFFGYAVACNADVDGDGTDDVVVGAPLATTYDGIVGAIYVFSGKTGLELMSQFGRNAGFDDYFGSLFGNWVDGLPDANGDGKDELVVGANLDQEVLGTPAGAVYMITLADFPASWRNYGEGWPGTLCTPAFIADAPPVLGDSIILSLENSAGVDTVGLALAGFAKAAIPTGAGGTLLVAPPWISMLLPVSAGGLDLSLSVPSDVVLAGIEVDLQVLELDGGASSHLSFTQGLELILGG